MKDKKVRPQEPARNSQREYGNLLNLEGEREFVLHIVIPQVQREIMEFSSALNKRVWFKFSRYCLIIQSCGGDMKRIILKDKKLFTFFHELDQFFRWSESDKQCRPAFLHHITLGLIWSEYIWSFLDFTQTKSDVHKFTEKLKY